MKVTLLLGFIGGFAGVLAGAHYYPWMEHERVPSKTTVQPNGGRLEQFVIRLPADRIGGAGVAGETIEIAGPLEVGELLLGHFKVRDVDGNVIGVAARHWTPTDDGAAGAWWVVIPSRGAILLSGDAAAPRALEEALAAAGRREGSAWSGEVEVGETGASRIVLGSQEFAGLEGEYSERWRITGVNEQGQLRGTIELATITFSGV